MQIIIEADMQDRGRTSGEFEMLSKRLCPHTGVMNFFFEAEPHFAVGSVVRAEGRGYLWRCYADPFEAVGTEADMTAAEERVAELCRKAAAHADEPPATAEAA